MPTATDLIDASLLTREEDVLVDFEQVTTLPSEDLLQPLFDFISVMTQYGQSQWPWLLAITVFAVVIYAGVRRILAPILARASKLYLENPNFSTNLRIQCLSTFVDYLMPLLVFGLITLHHFVLSNLDSSKAAIWLAPACLTITTCFIIIDTLLKPQGNLALLESVSERTRRTMRHRAKFLSVQIGLGFFGYILRQQFDWPASAVGLTETIFLVIFGLNALWLIFASLRTGYFGGATGNLRVIASIIIFGCLFAECLGYSSLARFVFSGTLLSVIVISLWLIAKTMVDDVMGALENPEHRWHQNLRKYLHIETEDALTVTPWVSLLSNFTLLCIAAVALLRVWGLSEQSLAWLEIKFFDGFQIGKAQIVPLKILFGLVVFFVLLSIAKGLSRRTSRGKMLSRKLDASAIETFAKVTTYLGFIAAAIIGLSVAGFNFQNLAILAGALSVGIGFGLQNIVNNFVSGIILLFERPVRTGDWVQVGGTEGFVKNVRVRSTEIQTWDRTDVVIPNSEFISQQVTNYTLRDPFGRIVVKVGVAYGSNTQLVKELLLGVAKAHTKVIKDYPGNKVPNPSVIFREFGDSSLNFELRVFVREITEKLFILSDINFAIDKAFRDNDVEIPFPQRDLHLRSSIALPKSKD